MRLINAGEVDELGSNPLFIYRVETCGVGLK